MVSLLWESFGVPVFLTTSYIRSNLGVWEESFGVVVGTLLAEGDGDKWSEGSWSSSWGCRACRMSSSSHVLLVGELWLSWVCARLDAWIVFRDGRAWGGVCRCVIWGDQVLNKVGGWVIRVYCDGTWIRDWVSVRVWSIRVLCVGVVGRVVGEVHKTGG